MNPLLDVEFPPTEVSSNLLDVSENGSNLLSVALYLAILDLASERDKHLQPLYASELICQ